MKQNPKTIKQILNISFLSVSIPALILLLVLTCYTISRQIHADQSDTEIQLSQVTTHMEEVLKRSETQLNNLVVPGSPFHSFHYSNTQLEKYQNAYTILQILRPILTQDSCLGGFFLYSKEKSDNCYYPSSNIIPMKTRNCSRITLCSRFICQKNAIAGFHLCFQTGWY